MMLHIGVISLNLLSLPQVHDLIIVEALSWRHYRRGCVLVTQNGLL